MMPGSSRAALATRSSRGAEIIIELSDKEIVSF